MAPEQWKLKFDGEMQAAVEARAGGNEGKARVCARRAAGVAVGEYLVQRNIPPAASAIKRLETLRDLPGIPPIARQSAEYLLQTVDQDHNLPSSIDLIAETRRLLQALELETDNPNPTR